MYYDRHDDRNTTTNSTTEIHKQYFKSLLAKGRDDLKLQERQPAVFEGVYSTSTQLPHVPTTAQASASSSSSSSSQATPVKPEKAVWKKTLAAARAAIEAQDLNALQKAIGPAYPEALTDYFRPARKLYWDWTNQICELTVLNAVEHMILNCVLPQPQALAVSGVNINNSVIFHNNYAPAQQNDTTSEGAPTQVPAPDDVPPVVKLDANYNMTENDWAILRRWVINQLNKMLVQLEAARSTNGALPFINVTLTENVRTDALNKLVFYVKEKITDWEGKVRPGKTGPIMPEGVVIPIYEILYFSDQTRKEKETNCATLEQQQQTLYQEKYLAIPVDAIWKKFQTDTGLDDTAVAELRNSGVASESLGIDGVLELSAYGDKNPLELAIIIHNAQGTAGRKELLPLIENLIKRGARINPANHELLHEKFALLKLALTYGDMPTPLREGHRVNYLERATVLNGFQAASPTTDFFDWLAGLTHDKNVMALRSREITQLFYYAAMQLSSVTDAQLLEITADIKSNTRHEAIKIFSITLYQFDSMLFDGLDRIQQRFAAPAIHVKLLKGPGDDKNTNEPYEFRKTTRPDDDDDDDDDATTTATTNSNNNNSFNNTTSAAQGLGFSGFAFLTPTTIDEQELQFPTAGAGNIQHSADPYGRDGTDDEATALLGKNNSGTPLPTAKKK